jgi:polar amino acid transport system substrate-binding protein
MQLKKTVIIGVLGLALVLSIRPTALAQTLERIQSSGTFNIGFVTDEAPVTFIGEDGKARGYAVELGQKIAEALKAKVGLPGLTTKFIATGLKDGLDMVAEGRIDLLCGATSDTLKRRERVSFSLPILVTGTAAILRKDAPPDLLRVLQGQKAYSGPIWRGSINRGLADHTYAVHAGTVTEEWVRERIATLGVIAKVVTVEDHAKGVEMVANKKADAYFADRVILENYATRSKHADELMVLDRYFTLEPLAMAMARNNDDFRLVVDATLSRIFRSGEIVDIFRSYFGDPSEMTLTLFRFVARD